MTIRTLSGVQIEEPAQGTKLCEYRTVSKDGRIVCAMIVQGDDQVSPEVCQVCPFSQVDCAHLCFSLRQVSPSPLVVRFNGRTELWDDDPPQLRFEHAACAARVIPVESPRPCAGCSLRQSPGLAADRPVRQRAIGSGAAIPFPQRQVAAAAG